MESIDVKSKETKTFQHRIITPNGNLKFVEENWHLYYNEIGNPIKALGTCSDIACPPRPIIPQFNLG